MNEGSIDKTTTYPCALTIAGSDSGGGAGIQADLKTFAAFGVYGASVITAITAQNTVTVRAVHDVPTDIIAAQLDAVLDDIPIHAIKIGMLSSADTIRIVADRLRAHRATNIVLDTVMVATSGNSLLHDEAVQVLKEELIPLATLITPNLPEAARLLNRKYVEDGITTAKRLRDLGASAVLLKGGHAETSEIADILLTADGTPYTFHHAKLAIKHTHGTGCSLSSAITAGLAQGCPLVAATEQAVNWLQGAIAHSWPLGTGHGPVHHFWQIWPQVEITGKKHG